MTTDWKDALRLQLEDLVDTLVVKGAKQDDVYDAIIGEIANLRGAYQRDPDPAEDRQVQRRRSRLTSGQVPFRDVLEDRRLQSGRTPSAQDIPNHTANSGALIKSMKPGRNNSLSPDDGVMTVASSPLRMRSVLICAASAKRPSPRSRPAFRKVIRVRKPARGRRMRIL